jgi:hypothetical protein
MINSVRNTVLSVLNKNNYGYISPSDFNLYAKQAQMELFEEYFSDYNKAVVYENQRVSGTDYADAKKAITELLELFLSNNFLYPVLSSAGTLTNRFFIPSDITTNDRAYMLSKIIYYNQLKAQGSNTLIVPFQLEDAGALFVTDGVVAGDIVTNNVSFLNATVLAVIGQTQLLLDTDIFTATPVTYSIFSSVNLSEAEPVTDGKITALSISPLTAPSTMFPAYTLNAAFLSTYPSISTGYGSVRASYFRYPLDPKWTFITLINGEPAFDQTQPDYQDFELPLEDEYKLVMKILQYCGISIRETQVVQYAMSQEQQGNAN